MFGKKYVSLVDSITLENPAADYKLSKRVGQYHVSEKALYKPDGAYLPFAAVKEYVQDRTSVHVSGCCAGGVMVDRLLFVTDQGKFPFLFDHQKEVEKVLAVLRINLQ